MIFKNLFRLPLNRNFVTSTLAKQQRMTKKALIIASDGSEEMELVITADVLRRAGINVIIAGLQDRDQIVCSRKVSINVDDHFANVYKENFDAIILPGGQPGSDNLAKDARVGEIMKRHETSGKIVAAICAAPLAIHSHGIAVGGSITSYPSVKEKLTGYDYSEEPVHVWNKVITSRGPATAFDFALKIVDNLLDDGGEKSNGLRDAMLLNCR